MEKLTPRKSIFEEKDADVLIKLAERALKGSMHAYERSRGVMAIRRLKALKTLMQEQTAIALIKESDALRPVVAEDAKQTPPARAGK